MKIGILQTGRVPDHMQSEHGDYGDIYQDMLAGHGFEFEVFAALDGELPNSVNAADGWIITGSKFSAYGKYDWIAPLEEFLRQAYQANVPIVGVCFGHQILAQALGGTVEKFSKGWSVGATKYDVKANGTNTGTDTVMAWHQDQITKLPAGATVTGSSDFCKYAMLAYGDKALSIQAHPEFTPKFVSDLIGARRDLLPEKIADDALANLDAPLTSSRVADQFATFFLNHKRTLGR